MLLVREVMAKDPTTVAVDEVVGTVRDLMLDGGGHGVPVLDAQGGLAGIITGSDLVEEWAPQQGVTTVMTDQVRVVPPETPVSNAAMAMRDHGIHHLVVVGPTGIEGVVSSHDLLEALAREVEAVETRTVAAREQARPGDHVVIRGKAVGQRARTGLIVEVRGADGGPPYVVQWLDDPHEEAHEVLFFPGPDADVEPASQQQETAAG